MKKFSIRHLILAGILLLSIAGAAIDVYATTHGPWGYNDPVEYIATAHSLNAGTGLGYIQGHGRFSPILIHPPFYSMVLAAAGVLHVNLIVAARWLSIFAFVACIFIAGWTFFRYSRAPAMGLLAAALLLVFPNMIWMFSSAYSEPLFILLILAGGLCLVAYLHKERLALLIASAVLIGLIAVTRYAGVAMIAAGALCVLFFSSGKFWVRLRKAVVFGLVASLPVAVWLVWVYFNSAHSFGGRSLGADWKDMAAKFQTFRGLFIDTVGRWVPFQSGRTSLTYRLRYLLAGLGGLAVLGLSVWAILRIRKSPQAREDPSGLAIFAFYGLSLVFFVAVLLLTYLFTMPTIDIDNRMLLPFFACAVMALFGALALWQMAWTRGWRLGFQIFAWLATLVCVWAYLPQMRDKVDFYHNGDGLTAYRWGSSGLVRAVEALPADQPVVSNDWQLLLLWTGRPIHGMWVSFPADQPLQTGPYGSLAGDPAQAVFCGEGGALVLLNDFQDQFKSRFPEATVEQQEQLFDGLQVYGTYPEGTIYTCH
jgi:4-amino-4-deoxy-L-arabinose transferase-like glycosyltransferase